MYKLCSVCVIVNNCVMLCCVVFVVFGLCSCVLAASFARVLFVFVG